ncbi:MAG: aldolase/citrate lyase family protein [Cellulosimicrobium cellulans]
MSVPARAAQVLLPDRPVWEHAAAWLYVPAVRPERFAKAAAAADGVVIDLEDAVHPTERPAARASLARHLGQGLAVPLVVRVNPPSGPDFDKDIAALAPLVRAGIVCAVRVAKVDSVEDAEEAAEATAAWGIDRRLICQLESARAVADAGAIAAVSGVHSLMLGEADLRADLGLPRGVAGESGLTLARQTVVLASRALGLPAPVGSAFTNVKDGVGLAASSAELAALGFYGRSCIHPGQVAAVRAAFSPRAAELAWAREVLATAGSMDESVSAAATLGDGSFIDPAIVRQAAVIVSRAKALEPHATFAMEGRAK